MMKVRFAAAVAQLFAGQRLRPDIGDHLLSPRQGDGRLWGRIPFL